MTSPALNMMRKKIKVSHECSASFANGPLSKITDSGSNLRICTLPNEILEIIFNLLPPIALMAIEDLGVERLTVITLSVKRANFSVCNTLQEDHLCAFFTKDRVKQIEEINLNNTFFVRPAILQRCVKHCENLTVLSILKCGLTLSHVESILHSCVKLEELYWTVTTYSATNKVRYKSPSLRKVYMFGDLMNPDGWSFLKCVLEMCPNVQDLYFDSYASPFKGITGKATFKEYPLKIIPNAQFELISDMLRYLSTLFELLESEFNFLSRAENVFFIMEKNSLQFIANEESLSELRPFKNDSVHSMAVLLTSSKHLLFPYIDDVAKMSGKKLQNLSLYDTALPGKLKDKDLVCEILSKFTLSCLNISVLNLSLCCFGEEFKLHSLHALKHLRDLSFPTCTICKDNSDAEGCDLDSFEAFATNCEGVEKFYLHSCSFCRVVPSEKSMDAISKWPRLTALSLYGVYISVCQFLLKVAQGCPRLTSLELICIGHPVCCLFIPNVSKFIKGARQLTYIRISHSAFSPNNTFFWRCVQSAKNLQAICLMFGVNTVVESKLIVHAIKKLPFLHCFHMRAPRYSQNLSIQIKGVMVSKGVQIPDVILKTITSYTQERQCFRQHVYC